MPIEIDLSRDSLFDAHGLERLRDGYMLPTEKSPQERYAYVATAFSNGDDKFAQRIYDYLSMHWLGPSSPILAYGRTPGGLPISCYLPYLHDSLESIMETSMEVRALTVAGGGIGLGVGLRSPDKKSTGIMAHLKTYDADMNAFKQQDTRRGSLAAYLGDQHPELMTFMKMRDPAGGQDPRLKCEDLHHAVNLSDNFMDRVYALSRGKYFHDGFEFPKIPALLEDLDKWPLTDPKTGKITQIASVKEIWQSIITHRRKTGEPFLHFIDRSNEFLPTAQKNIGLRVNQSNLCTEITLPTNKDRTAVCCLSSLNLVYYNDWKNNEDFIPDVVRFLDNVLTVFIRLTDNNPAYRRANLSAKSERSIGIGVLGFHSLLQSLGISFESALASSLNKQIFKHIQEKAYAGTLHLAEERGPAPDAVAGGGPRVRNLHTLAIAPTASNSIICGNASPGIEPIRANVFVQKTLSGSKVYQNPYLKRLFKEKGIDNERSWSNVIAAGGSVLGMEELTDYEKSIFKTAVEIDQNWIIEHAADRQPFIDQAQSVNLFFEPTADLEYVHNVHLNAWAKGLKTLYYMRTEPLTRAATVGMQVERKIIEEDECLACQ